jgi:LysM repeat protein
MVLILLTLFTAPVFAQDDQIHVVQRGETLFRIALRYGISTKALVQANNITNPSRILAGQRLIIPKFDPSPAVVENPLVAGTPTTHTVQPGETVASIAALYGMTPDQLVQINNLTNPNRILRGQQLTVWSTAPLDPNADPNAVPQVNIAQPIQPETTVVTPAPALALPTAIPQAAPASQTYIVKPGEHLSQIAQRYGISWTVIAQANNIANPDQIYAGQTLIIPTGNKPSNDYSSAVQTNGYDPALPFPPQPTILVGKQIVVDLSEQRLYAFDNGNLVREVVVSTGLPGTPTVLGDYTVYVKYTAQTMSGPGYYLPGVPYVMYFYQGYSLHGTYWHNNFGHPMSHGCVNMPTPEAEWFYNNFVEVGTPIHVQL